MTQKMLQGLVDLLISLDKPAEAALYRALLSGNEANGEEKAAGE